VVGIELRDYQQEALASFDQAWARGIHRMLAALPTGTGKTVIFAAYLWRRGGRTLVLVHRDELIAQSIEKLILAGVPAHAIGVVKAELDQHDRRVVVASVPTLAQASRLARLIADFETVIVDEAHHAVAETYRRILDYVRAFEGDGPLVIGFTATAERHDGGALGDVFEVVVFEKDLLEMIRRRYLSDIAAIQIKLQADFNSLHTRRGDFIESEVENLLVSADAPKRLVEAYQEHARDRKTIVFTSGVKLAKLCAAEFVKAGIRAEEVDGETPLQERRAILKRFKAGETMVVCNCGVLVEGFDEPSVTCIVMARPTQSSPLYRQMIGRGLRRYPGKECCLIIDVVGASTRHDLMTTATLLGLDPKGTLTTSVIAAVEEKEAAEARVVLAGKLVAQRVDLFKTAPFGWVAITPLHFVLSMGKAGDLHLRGRDDRWAVHHHHRDGSSEALAWDQSVEFAQGIAEDTARRIGPSVLIARDAPWRSQPASPAQLATLRKCRIRVQPNITKGEAAELLTKAIAKRFA
jgi:superfamily II DNA or RNA helicase